MYTCGVCVCAYDPGCFYTLTSLIDSDEFNGMLTFLQLNSAIRGFCHTVVGATDLIEKANFVYENNWKNVNEKTV